MCYNNEIEKTIDEINNNRSSHNVCFALLADTHLSDTGVKTRSNIKAVDEKVNFDFMVHLGGITNGNNPCGITMDLMKRELNKYREAIGTRMLFPVCGRTDGYRNERFLGQLAMNIMTHELWCENTTFLKEYDVARDRQKAYYYYDIPLKKVRLIFLCSYTFQIDEENGLYEKTSGFDVEQIAWFRNDALKMPKGYTALIFSNCMPKSKFEVGNDPFSYNGYSTEQVRIIVQQAMEEGKNVAAWIFGDYNCDAEVKHVGINFVAIASQNPVTSSTAKCDDIRVYKERKGVNEDLWDGVVLNTENRTIKFVRFGAGEDRIINY